jgi:hypothetical protein
VHWKPSRGRGGRTCKRMAGAVAENGIVIRRLRKLCAALTALKDEVEVTTFGNIHADSFPQGQPQLAPAVGMMRPAF